MTAQRSKRNKAPARIVRPAVEQVEQGRPVTAAWLAIIFVLVVTFLAYLPALRYQYVYDDVQQIVQNPNIESWSHLPDYFTKHVWVQDSRHRAQYYRPLFLLWLRTNRALFGLDPFWWHLTTLAAHLLATLMVFVLVRLLLRSWMPAALSALFFGLHPVHIEVATWISSVSEALLAAALIASLACYAQGTLKKDRRGYAGALIFFAVALLFKEIAMVFPAIIFTFAWLWSDKKPNTGRFRFAVIQTLPFAALTVVYLVVRNAALKGIVAALAPISIKTLALTVPSVLLFYGRLLVWPAGLSPIYDTPLVEQLSAENFFFPILVIVAAVCLLALLFFRARKSANGVEIVTAEGRLTILAFVWMIVFILPALYLPALQYDALVHDRYVYVPSVGFAILLGIGLSKLGRGSRRIFTVPWVQAASALALAGIMVAGIEAQSSMWSDNMTLFTRAIELAPENRIALHELSATLVGARRNDDAIAILRKLLSQNPNDSIDNNNLGQAYVNKGDLVDAEVYLARSCQRNLPPGSYTS